MSILCSCIMETKVIPVLIVEMLNLSGGRQMARVGINHGIRQWHCLAAGRGILLLLLLQGIGFGAGTALELHSGASLSCQAALSHPGHFRTGSANPVRARMNLPLCHQNCGENNIPPTTFLVERIKALLNPGQNKSFHPHIARVCRENHAMTHEFH